MRKLTFASLQVSDLEVSKAFYTATLGFEVSEMSNPYACVFKYQQGEASFAIRTPLSKIDGKERGIGTSIWFEIDENIEALQSQLTEKGVPLIGGINATPFGKTLMAKDPDGYVLTFLETI
jgi:lactoylglutathione lyase